MVGLKRMSLPRRKAEVNGQEYNFCNWSQSVIIIHSILHRVWHTRKQNYSGVPRYAYDQICSLSPTTIGELDGVMRPEYEPYRESWPSATLAGRKSATKCNISQSALLSLPPGCRIFCSILCNGAKVFILLHGSNFDQVIRMCCVIQA